MADKHRVLIISHGHPDFSPGGGEIAAYSLFKELDKRENCRAVFMARHDLRAASHLGTPFSTRDEKGKEVLFCSYFDDFFLLSQPQKRNIWHYFRLFLEEFRPTIVHFHHYVHLGIELIREVKNYSAKAPIMMTLHDYTAICHHNGQMVKTNGDQLCQKASSVEFHRCFPNKSPEDFFLRESYLKSFFKLIDLFISPSQFLIDRYNAWGISAERMVVVENGQSLYDNRPENKGLEMPILNTRFAFFGELSRFKGIVVLFEAWNRLPKSLRTRVTLDIFGSNLHLQPEDFQRFFKKQLKHFQKSVQFHGSYRVDEIDELMANIGWVIVPSIWWENSPLVIQEAFKNRRPVICSNIGGMAEKVEDGFTGVHFRARDTIDLANQITKGANDPNLWRQMSLNITSPQSIFETTNIHLDLYSKLNYPRQNRGVI